MKDEGLRYRVRVVAALQSDPVFGRRISASIRRPRWTLDVVLMYILEVGVSKAQGSLVSLRGLRASMNSVYMRGEGLARSYTSRRLYR